MKNEMYSLIVDGQRYRRFFVFFIFRHFLSCSLKRASELNGNRAAKSLHYTQGLTAANI